MGVFIMNKPELNYYVNSVFSLLLKYSFVHKEKDTGANEVGDDCCRPHSKATKPIEARCKNK